MKTLFLILGLLLPVAGLASESGFPMEEAKVDQADKASLQRGAKYFVNYCMGCHSLQYLRYNRLAEDLGLTDEQVRDNLIFTHDDEGAPTKIGDTMKIAMDKWYGKTAFGTLPPDLTLVTRWRSPDWVYNYLRDFYLDETKQWGVNNAMFPNVGMPHVLWELQGWQKPVYEDRVDQHGKTHKVLVKLEQVQPGKMTPAEFDRAALDITNFLSYAAEPARKTRYLVGFWVLFFLLILSAIAYLLKNEYWRDVK
ncbi:MAG TPA: cytochrome c1 [Gammaproteobacteria bacterium]|nr:cytochrome c1 [Gammaproteobacteria bacterium]